MSKVLNSRTNSEKKSKKPLRLIGDFETTVDELDCRVWGYGVTEIGDESKFQCGTNIEQFINYCSTLSNATMYFHNLKFDGEFIMHELFRQGFTYVHDRRKMETKTFSTLISSTGMFYSMNICFQESDKNKNQKKQTLEIIDSLKIIPMPVKAIAKGFNLPMAKGEIDYKTYRPVNHRLTAQEIDYIRKDVEIVAGALKVLHEQGLEKMTQGSNAFHDYVKVIGGEKKFEKYFPIPDYDHAIRLSYRGGFTYANPKFVGKDIDWGVVFDVNSLYPSVMYYEMLPYGSGLFYQGKYEEDYMYNLYVQRLSCSFELKDEHIPTIQLKNNGRFIPTEYLTTSNDEIIELNMTSVDLELFFEHYHVTNIEYHDGWMFKSTNTLFRDYIDKWSAVKIQSAKDKNKALYTLAKLMLNALYGKFALNPKVQSKYPTYDPDTGEIRYIEGEEEWRDPIYIPVGTFVTAYARRKTIKSAQAVYHRFIYADTDSLHLMGSEIPEGLDIDPTRLGAWKHESTFGRARFLRAKTYFESHRIDNYDVPEFSEQLVIIDGYWCVDAVTCAGMPDSSHKYVTWDNFHEGAVYSGKLQMKRVVGGIVLRDIDFSINNH